MSVTVSEEAPQGAVPAAGDPPRGGSCPLCDGPLRPDQEWCLRCGAAARTRLAAAPNWRVPAAVLAAVAALSLGVLAAAFVKLAGDSSPARPQATVAPAAGATAPAATQPGASTAPAATQPGAAAPGATAPVTPTAATPTATTPGATAPATPTATTGGKGATSRTGSTSGTGATSRTGATSTTETPK